MVFEVYVIIGFVVALLSTINIVKETEATANMLNPLHKTISAMFAFVMIIFIWPIVVLSMMFGKDN
jgi:hypothetical protein